MLITARIQNVDQTKLKTKIPQNILNKIKTYDKKPYFELYNVASPTISATGVVGVGPRLFNWPNSTLKQLFTITDLPIPAFHGHNEDNSHENREPIGVIVKTEINNAANITAIVHRYQNSRHIKTDIASFEANIKNYDPSLYDENTPYTVQPEDVQPIEGVALANSQTVQPAFNTAVKLASIQCLNKPKIGGIKTMERDDLVEIITALKAAGVFNNSQPTNAQGATTLEIEHLKDENAKLKKKAEQMEKSHKDELASIKETSMKAAFPAKVKDTLATRDKLTEQQKAFILKMMDKTPIDITKTVEENVEAFINGALANHNEIAAIFADSTAQTKEGNPGDLPNPENFNSGNMSPGFGNFPTGSDAQATAGELVNI